MTGLPALLENLPELQDEAEIASLRALEQRLGYRFVRLELLRVALTLASWCNEHATSGWPSNESLEFFGDAVLDLVAADELWRRFPAQGEGPLTRLRATLVSEEALAAAAQTSKLGDWLFLGKGDEQRGGREREASLADTVEAVMGAAFLDARAASQDPLAAASAVFRALLGERADGLAPDHGIDAKSRLQHWAQRVHRATPTYLTEAAAESTPEQPQWISRVVFSPHEGEVQVLGEGQARSMRRAQQAAAVAALAAIKAPKAPDHGS